MYGFLSGSEDMKESSSPEKTLKSQNIVPKTPDKLEGKTWFYFVQNCLHSF